MADETLDAVWKALSDPTRRRLLDLLRERPRTTGELAAAFDDLSRFAVMKHLRVLEGAGLVVVRRQGRQTWHYLNAVPLRRIYERWVSAYESEWASSLLRIGERAEGRGGAPMEVTGMQSFQIEQEVLIEADPQRVFAALVDAGAWWSHSFTQRPRVRLEPTIGGKFYEEFGDGEGGALYAIVTQVKPGERLALSGPMGMPGAVIGVIRFDLEAKGSATVLRLSHHVIGEVDENLRRMYDEGWRELLGRHLKDYAERGVRYWPEA